MKKTYFSTFGTKCCDQNSRNIFLFPHLLALLRKNEWRRKVLFEVPWRYSVVESILLLESFCFWYIHCM